jgi:hypothetical protein
MENNLQRVQQTSGRSADFYNSLALPLHRPNRGSYGGFTMIGRLARNNSVKAFPLYGRRLLPNKFAERSDSGPIGFEYYTVNPAEINGPGREVVLKISLINKDQLATGDRIQVPGYTDLFTVILSPPEYEYSLYAPY